MKIDLTILYMLHNLLYELMNIAVKFVRSKVFILLISIALNAIWIFHVMPAHRDGSIPDMIAKGIASLFLSVLLNLLGYIGFKELMQHFRAHYRRAQDGYIVSPFWKKRD